MSLTLFWYLASALQLQETKTNQQQQRPNADELNKYNSESRVHAHRQLCTEVESLQLYGRRH